MAAEVFRASLMTRLSRFSPSDLGPHADVLVTELRGAAMAGLPVACIVLAATLVDVVTQEEAGPAGYLDGMAFAYAGNTAALGWLRGRRNLLLHHEGPSDGLMGEAPAHDWLCRDAERAVETVLDFLQDLDVGS